MANAKPRTRRKPKAPKKAVNQSGAPVALCPFFSAQDYLHKAFENETVSLANADYGPLVVSKSVIINSNGASFYSLENFPAIEIKGRSVCIQNAFFRFQSQTRDLFEQPIVLRVSPGCQLALENVGIYGHVEGIAGESEPWLLPSALDLGNISATNNYYVLEVGVPIKCRLRCVVNGIDLDPAALVPGINTVKLRLRDVTPESLIFGNLEIITPLLTRLIPLAGRVTKTLTGSSVSSTLCSPTQAQREKFLALRSTLALSSVKQNQAIPIEPPIKPPVSSDISKKVADLDNQTGAINPKQTPFEILANGPLSQNLATDCGAPPQKIQASSSVQNNEANAMLGKAFASRQIEKSPEPEKPAPLLPKEQKVTEQKQISADQSSGVSQESKPAISSIFSNPN